jgi:hypothetical protein
MSLQLIVDTVDALPEAVREFYEPDGEKFRLKVEGVEDTSGLKSALKREREAREAAERTAKEFTGLNPKEIRKLIAEREAAAEASAREKGDFDAVLAQHRAKWQQELDAIKGERDALATAERRATVGNTLTQALAKAGVTEEGLELLQDRLASRIKSETQDGKRLHRVMHDDGVTPLAGTAADGFATLDDLVNEATKRYPALFKAKGTGGSGTPPNKQAGTAAATISRKTFDGMSASARAAHFKAGGQITD